MNGTKLGNRRGQGEADRGFVAHTSIQEWPLRLMFRYRAPAAVCLLSDTSLFLNLSRLPVSPAVCAGCSQLGPCGSGAGPRPGPASFPAARQLLEHSGGREFGDPVKFFSGARWKCCAPACGPTPGPKRCPATHPPGAAKGWDEHIPGLAAKRQDGGGVA